MEYYKQLTLSKDPLIKRRILLAKWMYVQGFLNTDFPPTERYIPHHLQREVEDAEEAVASG